MHHALHYWSKITVSDDPFRSSATQLITIISPFPPWAQLPYYALFKILTPSTLSRNYEFVQQTLTGSELRNGTERKGYFWSLRDVVLAL
jgi:quinol-cytochrome oxidoreductase complex cytochrome b subunit